MALSYTPLRDELCIETALAQSAHVLDLAAKMAVESRDVEGLMKVAQGWAELTRGLENKKNEEARDTDEKKMKVGF